MLVLLVLIVLISLVDESVLVRVSGVLTAVVLVIVEFVMLVSVVVVCDIEVTVTNVSVMLVSVSTKSQEPHRRDLPTVNQAEAIYSKGVHGARRTSTLSHRNGGRG